MATDSSSIPVELRALAGAHGILPTYVDDRGVVRTARRDVVVAVLEAMGVADAGTDAHGALLETQRQRASAIIEPVVVLEAGPDARVEVRLDAHDDDLDCEIVLEDGSVVDFVARADALEHVTATDAAQLHARLLVLPVALEPGYHALTVSAGGRQSVATLLVRPPNGARGRFSDEWRAFGVFAPLFTLHSERSWGAGDLSDLDELAARAAAADASVVATLPLLAGFGPASFEPSPYLPISRQFWHERWLDVDAMPELRVSARAQAVAAGARHLVRSSVDATFPYVDGARALAAKRSVLMILADETRASRTARAAALESYLTDRPEVGEYARFRAAGERLGTDWRRWPRRLRDNKGFGPGDVDPATVQYHEFAQWAVHGQLTRVAERCEQRGQVLSLDLPLGVHPLGFDVWRHRDQFVEGVSVGAPPDRFFPSGQRWSFLPNDVEAVRRDGHSLFRAALVHHMNVAGMLRIDHVLGLQRLFWIPDGVDPVDGVYVAGPLDEHLAVIAIEAHRHRASIVGEDLGTVDGTVRRAMERDGIRRTHVVELSLSDPGAVGVPAPPHGAVASFSTHDLPTFVGWWQGRDIEERVMLGHMDPQAGADALTERLVERRRLAALVDAELEPGDPGPPSGLIDTVHRALAASDAGLVLVQLDDVVGELDAVNLPGTWVERPNWQRLTEAALGDDKLDQALDATLDSLRELRPPDDASRGRGGREVATVFGVSLLGALDDHLFNEGRHTRLYDKLGSHAMPHDDVDGTYFAVWAPNAAMVEVIGDFNSWDGSRHPLERHHQTGIWEGFVPGVRTGERYKYRITSSVGGEVADKADPCARQAELAPLTASITTEPAHEWRDDSWMQTRPARQSAAAPICIYELHLGSWRHVPEDADRPLTYRELAPLLVEHVVRHGFTHVELMPVMEHPFYGSWGYHVTGFFAPTSRYGDADDFAALVDALHQAGVGVILDWVPAHFPSDAFALARFDGTCLYEHADARQGVHPDWHSLIFNYGRNEVRAFLISAACYWVDRFHIDGLRFDAVASMLYLDYSRRPGEWVPNRYGGRENLDAIELLVECNAAIHHAHPDVLTFAEESTSWPGVTATSEEGGLGFDFKWDLGWMHDTLDYLARDPIHRRWHHNQLTFRTLYATTEQFVLPLSHDEVVHGKRSLVGQMAGDDWQRFANLRLLYGYQLAQPGKKLLFMGDEFAQLGEWAHDASLDWHLLDHPAHQGIAALVARCNQLYRAEPALHRDDLADRGFAWIDGDDRDQSVICVERHDGEGSHLVIVCNATPQPREHYRVGVPHGGTWSLRLNSDWREFGGSGYPVEPVVTALDEPFHSRAHSVLLTLPPLGWLVFAHDVDDR